MTILTDKDEVKCYSQRKSTSTSPRRGGNGTSFFSRNEQICQCPFWASNPSRLFLFSLPWFLLKLIQSTSALNIIFFKNLWLEYGFQQIKIAFQFCYNLHIVFPDVIWDWAKFLISSRQFCKSKTDHKVNKTGVGTCWAPIYIL